MEKSAQGSIHLADNSDKHEKTEREREEEKTRKSLRATFFFSDIVNCLCLCLCPPHLFHFYVLGRFEKGKKDEKKTMAR